MTPSPLNILLVSNLFPNPQEPERGIFTLRFAQALSRRANVTVISPLPWFPKMKCLQKYRKWSQFSMTPLTCEMEGIHAWYPKYFLLPKISGALHPFLVFLSLFGLISKLHRTVPIDVINARWIYPDAVAAAWCARILGIPIIAGGGGSDINLIAQNRWKRFQIVQTLNSVQRITAVSQALRSAMIKLGLPAEKIRVVPGGIDLDRFHPLNQGEARQKLGLQVDPHEKVMLFIGHLYEVKGVKYLLEAVARLSQSGEVNYKLYLVGEGAQRAHLEALASRFHLSGKVFFVGPRPHGEISLWLGACDLLVLPSLHEGMPNVVIEALASGRPVVASAVGGIPEVVSEEKDNGLLCQPKDVSGLAAAIRRVLQRNYSPEALAKTVDGLSWDANVEACFHGMEHIMKKDRLAGG